VIRTVRSVGRIGVSVIRRSATTKRRVTPSTNLPDGLRCLRGWRNLLKRINLICPVQPHCQKYSPSPLTQITSISPAVPPHMRGVSRSSRTRGGMRWTRMVLLTRAPVRGRRSRVVLTPRRWRQVGGSNSAGDGDKQARSPGRARRKPLKPLACGNAGCSGATVVTTLVCHQHFAHEAAGAAGTRHSPRPLISWANDCARLGCNAPRECERVFGIGCLKFELGNLRRPGQVSAANAIRDP
jgi:hypothetical protein